MENHYRPADQETNAAVRAARVGIKKESADLPPPGWHKWDKCVIVSRMGRWVNYNKRSISLPLGCKDLADLLRARPADQAMRTQHRFENAKRTFAESCEIPTSELARFVHMGFQTYGLLFFLSVGREDGPIKLTLTWIEGELEHAVALVPAKSAKASAVRAYLLEQGLNLPPENSVPPTFDPELPVFSLYDISTLTTDAPGSAKLLEALLRTAEDGDRVHVACEEFCERE